MCCFGFRLSKNLGPLSLQYNVVRAVRLCRDFSHWKKGISGRIFGQTQDAGHMTVAHVTYITCATDWKFIKHIPFGIAGRKLL